MKLKNRIVGVIGILALCAMTAQAFVFKHDSFRRELQPDGKSMVIMMNGFGSVEVISTKEDCIVVEADVFYSDPVQAGITALLGGTPMKIHDRKDRWEIKSEFDPDIGYVDCKLTVPEKMKLEIQSSGKVVCNNHKGPYKITSATGAQVTIGKCEVAATVSDTESASRETKAEAIKDIVNGFHRLLTLQGYLNDLK